MKVVLGVKWPSRTFGALQLRKCVGFSDALSTFLLPRLKAFSCRDAIPPAKTIVADSLTAASRYLLSSICQKLMIEMKNECKQFLNY